MSETVEWVAPVHEEPKRSTRMNTPFCVCRDCGQADRCDHMTKADGRHRCAACAKKD